MGIFKRLRDLTAATVNDVLDSLEDPVVMLNQYMRDLEAEIGRAEVAVARQVALEKRFLQQWEEARAMAEKRERQVELALAEGNDDLARRALIDKKHHEARAAECEQLCKAAHEAAMQMREKLAELKDEFYRMRAKKYALATRAQVARTRKHLNQVIAGIGSESAVKGFARMEEKVLRMEAEAELSDEWRRVKVDRPAWSSRADMDAIDAELAAIRARLNRPHDNGNGQVEAAASE